MEQALRVLLDCTARGGSLAEAPCSALSQVPPLSPQHPALVGHAGLSVSCPAAPAAMEVPLGRALLVAGCCRAALSTAALDGVCEHGQGERRGGRRAAAGGRDSCRQQREGQAARRSSCQKCHGRGHSGTSRPCSAVQTPSPGAAPPWPPLPPAAHVGQP